MVIGLDSGTIGIQTARILARRSVPVIAIARDPKHPCCRTRVCDQILFTDVDSVELITTLEKLAGSLERKAVLFPCEDQVVLLVSRHRDRLLDGFHVILPSPDVVELMTDKRRLLRVARLSLTRSERRKRDYEGAR